MEFGDADVQDLSLVESAAYTGVAIHQNERISTKYESIIPENCPSLDDFWKPILDEFAGQLVGMNVPAGVAEQLMDVDVEETGVSLEQSETLRNSLPVSYQSLFIAAINDQSTGTSGSGPKEKALETPQSVQTVSQESDLTNKTREETSSAYNSQLSCGLFTPYWPIWGLALAGRRFISV